MVGYSQKINKRQDEIFAEGRKFSNKLLNAQNEISAQGQIFGGSFSFSKRFENIIGQQF